LKIFNLNKMIPNLFDYKRAASVSEAIALLKSDSNAKVLAGGHSLIPAMKLRLAQPGLLVDISKIGDLNFIRDRGKYIAIGSMTTHGAIAESKTINNKVPILAWTAEYIGDIQVRNKGTIGGSIAHADPASDWPATLIAADATIVVEGPFGERKIPAEDFFQGFFTTAIGENEIVTEIHVPDPTTLNIISRVSYQKFMQPASRFAVVGCAVQLIFDGNTIKDARVAFNGVSDHAYRAKAVEAALIGKDFNDDTIRNAAEHATEGTSMIMSDHYADEAYRAHLAKVYCRRALAACAYD
jgi:aerobic carbon-monoxide dehydrogenase medium subunit